MRTSSRGTTDGVARLGEIPTVALGDWPSPVVSAVSSVGEVLVKRDDRSGFGRGGAKTRKIEGLLGHLVASGYDELITFAGNITNLAFDITPVLRENGIRSTLLVADDPPMTAASRSRHFAGIRDDVRLLGPNRAAAGVEALRAYRRGRRQGRRPLLVLPGASHPSAVLGNARGMLELAEQRTAAGAELPGTIFVSVATGNTLAGFLVGAALLRMREHRPVRIVGVQVYPGPITPLTRAQLMWARRWLGVRNLPLPPWELVSSELAGRFGGYRQRLVGVCERVAEDNGFDIDPIFGGKTWSAMESALAEGRVSGPCLYWHCGYTPEWRDLCVTTPGIGGGADDLNRYHCG